MADKFKENSDSVSAPARKAIAVSPHDVDALTDVPKALYVGAGGDIVCCMIDDSEDVAFVGVPTGAILPIRVSHVRSTGTTAASILALY